MTGAPQSPREQRTFPGWPFAWVALAIPIAGYIGWTISGPVDTVEAALIGGALTGAGLAAASGGRREGRSAGRRPGSPQARGSYAVGLAAGAALVRYETDLGALALMGLVSGASLGTAEGLVLARQGKWRLGMAWGAAMPVLFALSWLARFSQARTRTA